MAQIGREELLARLKKGKPIPAILLLGEEPYCGMAAARS